MGRECEQRRESGSRIPRKHAAGWPAWLVMKNICISVVKSLDLAKPWVFWIGALPPRYFQNKKDIVNHDHIYGCVHNGRYYDNCIVGCFRCVPSTITVSYTAGAPGLLLVWSLWPTILEMLLWASYAWGWHMFCIVAVCVCIQYWRKKKSKYKPVAFGLGMWIGGRAFVQHM